MRSQEPTRRYAIALQLHYKAKIKHGPLYGSGQSRMISSKDIIFDGGKGLEPGMNAEIVLEWPRLLDDRIRLQLVLRVTITGSQDGVTEARIHTMISAPADRPKARNLAGIVALCLGLVAWLRERPGPAPCGRGGQDRQNRYQGQMPHARTIGMSFQNP
jgi:hypothetical protein